jgi:hypothetical protein
MITGLQSTSANGGAAGGRQFGFSFVSLLFSVSHHMPSALSMSPF